MNARKKELVILAVVYSLSIVVGAIPNLDEFIWSLSSLLVSIYLYGLIAYAYETENEIQKLRKILSAVSIRPTEENKEAIKLQRELKNDIS